jgi:hypothetical protein
MALVTALEVAIKATLSKSKDLGNIPTSALDFFKRVEMLSGVAAGQADKLWYDERTLAASTSEDLDMVGVQTDDFGDVFSPVRVKCIYLQALDANVNNVIVGGAASNAWAALLGATGTLTLRPGAYAMVGSGKADATGYVCAAGATDLLKVANAAAGSSVNYQIIIIGASA